MRILGSKMAHFKFQAWKFCRFLKYYADKDPTNAYYCRSIFKRMSDEEKYERWGSSLTGSINNPKINKKSDKVNFKVDLIRSSGVSIEDNDVVKFYYYIENRKYISIFYYDNRAVDWDKDDRGPGVVGIGVDGHSDLEMCVCLTEDGVDFADMTPIGLFNTEATWLISILALIVSVFSLAT